MKPHQGPDVLDEEYRTVYMLDLEVTRDEDEVVRAAMASASVVLVTNLPSSPSPDGDVRKGADPQKVLELYNGQFACEHAFRLMKSGLGLDSIYLQNPARVAGMLFIVSLVTMLVTLINAVLRDKGLKDGATVYRMRILFDNSRLVYDGTDWIHEGSSDRWEMFLERLELLSIDSDTFLYPRCC